MKEKILIICTLCFLTGLLGGFYFAPQKYKKTNVKEYKNYCEKFKGGEFSRLNGYPKCQIYQKYEKLK